MILENFKLHIDQKQTEHNRRSTRGFTLLEVLIAVSLLMIVIALAGMAMRIGFNSVTAGEKKIESLERFRSSLQIMFAQIDSEIPMLNPSSEEKMMIFYGAKTSLQFPTGYSIWEGSQGYVVVEYQVIVDKNGKMSLKASENRIGFQKSMETTLFSGLENISFAYAAHRENMESEEKWLDEWEEEQSLPEKIKLNLQYNGNKYSFIMLMRAQKIIK